MLAVAVASPAIEPPPASLPSSASQPSEEEQLAWALRESTRAGLDMAAPSVCESTSASPAADSTAGDERIGGAAQPTATWAARQHNLQERATQVAAALPPVSAPTTAPPDAAPPVVALPPTAAPIAAAQGLSASPAQLGRPRGPHGRRSPSSPGRTLESSTAEYSSAKAAMSGIDGPSTAEPQGSPSATPLEVSTTEYNSAKRAAQAAADGQTSNGPPAVDSSLGGGSASDASDASVVSSSDIASRPGDGALTPSALHKYKVAKAFEAEARSEAEGGSSSSALPSSPPTTSFTFAEGTLGLTLKTNEHGLVFDD